MRGGGALRRGSAPRPAHVRPRHQVAVADRWPLAHGAEREPAQGWMGVRVGLRVGLRVRVSARVRARARLRLADT